ncbi:hypothetical protein CKJ85_03125 [Corynebacterium sp. NML 150383]|uniref:DUF6541 family protein n=1 Tax=Corynebacterium sp. NML 150383 TaxID=2029400 RepID=UPI000BAA51D8|nr:DUF6541 family protein [Corynebacterium sp. NML 150383]PAT04410.1 hypothetical protein CKJ85_03125 [Corynebacterium sp. NML 150383]
MTPVAAAWFAVPFFLLPGFLFNLIAGAKGPRALAAALPVSFGIFGMSAWVWGLTSAPLDLWTLGVSLVVAFAAAAVWRYAFARKARRGGAVTWRRALFPGDWRKGSLLDLYWLLPTAGVVVGAWLLISERLDWLVRSPHGVYNIVQGWDVQWHANLVRFIMDEGIASPTRLGELQNVETHAQLLYPSAFHTGIAMFGKVAGLDPIPTLNIGMIALTGLALPATAACMAFAFLRSRGLTAQIAGGLAAILVTVAPQLIWVGDYVGMWPYLFAMSLTGMVIWQFVRVPAERITALPALVGLLGVLTAHPAAVTVVVIGVGLYWLTSTLVAPERGRISDTLWLAAPGIIGAVLYLPQVFAGSAQAEEVSGWKPVESEDLDSGWAAAFTMGTRHVHQLFPGFDPTVLLWLAGLGAVALVVWRRQVWAPLFYAIWLAIAANALAPVGGPLSGLLTLVGNLHYNTAHRLIFPVALSVAVGAAIGVAVMIRLFTLAPVAARLGSRGWEKGSGVASISIALVLALIGTPMVQAGAVDGERRAFDGGRNDDRMVDDDDLAAWDWLATQPAAWNGTIMGDPADGHSWAYAYNGLPTLSRHYLWPTGGLGSNMDITYWAAREIGEGLRGDPTAKNIVDEGAEALNIKFYMLSPGAFWPIQLERLQMQRGFWTSRGLTPVYRKGDVVIFAVNEQFTRAELEGMINDAHEHGSDTLYQLEPANGGAGYAAGAAPLQ